MRQNKSPGSSRRLTNGFNDLDGNPVSINKNETGKDDQIFRVSLFPEDPEEVLIEKNGP